MEEDLRSHGRKARYHFLETRKDAKIKSKTLMDKGESLHQYCLLAS